MTDRCRVSEDELRHDEEQMSESLRYEQAMRDAETDIGNLDDTEYLYNALLEMDASTSRDLKRKIRERDPSILGLLPILKQYFTERRMEE